MQAVELLRQRFPTNAETLEEMAAIADRIEKVADAVDLPNATRSPPGRNWADPEWHTGRTVPRRGANPRNFD